MNILGLEIPQWFFDYSGSVAVVISLIYLFRKQIAYWHWSNMSVVPFFILFVAQGAWLFAGLQISYLIFGIHGLYLWFLEQRRDRGEIRFNESAWYAVTWVVSLAIFGYTVYVTDFSNSWNWLQFFIVGIQLIANFGTTRKWTWSWAVWIVSNVMSLVYFSHAQIWGQFGLQFILIALSIKGWMDWAKDDQTVVASRGLKNVEAIS